MDPWNGTRSGEQNMDLLFHLKCNMGFFIIFFKGDLRFLVQSVHHLFDQYAHHPFIWPLSIQLVWSSSIWSVIHWWKCTPQISSFSSCPVQLPCVGSPVFHITPFLTFRVWSPMYVTFYGVILGLCQPRKISISLNVLSLLATDRSDDQSLVFAKLSSPPAHLQLPVNLVWTLGQLVSLPL